MQTCVVALLKQAPARQQLDEAFRVFFVAYQLFELALADYDYDPDEGMELRPELSAEIKQSMAEVEPEPPN